MVSATLKYVPQAAATTFAFPSVFLLKVQYWCSFFSTLLHSAFTLLQQALLHSAYTSLQQALLHSAHTLLQKTTVYCIVHCKKLCCIVHTHCCQKLYCIVHTHCCKKLYCIVHTHCCKKLYCIVHTHCCKKLYCIVHTLCCKKLDIGNIGHRMQMWFFIVLGLQLYRFFIFFSISNACKQCQILEFKIFLSDCAINILFVKFDQLKF